MFKSTLVTSTIILLTSCGKPACEIEYYERISGISFPANIEVVECNDNLEFVTTAFIKIPLQEINEFLLDRNFKKVSQEFEPQFLGIHFLSKKNLQFPKNESLYELSERSETNSWYYLVDKDSGKLWCEIQYADWGGTTP